MSQAPHNPYAQAVKRGVPVGSIIDVGASNAQWSRMVRPYWPRANILMLDANPAHEAELRAFAESSMPAAYVIAAAGPANARVRFHESTDKFGGVVLKEPSKPDAPPEFTEGRAIEVNQVTIDSIVGETQLPPPYFIKLDTHGYELEILEGARETLRHTTLVQIEVYNFRLREGVAVFPEMCFHMDAKGFRLADIFDVMHRPSDGLFWQADVFFESKAAPWWKSQKWE